jgi:hypothetical protein
MPPTATYEDIKAYQDKVENDKITPHHRRRFPVVDRIPNFSKFRPIVMRDVRSERTEREN